MVLHFFQIKMEVGIGGGIKDEKAVTGGADQGALVGKCLAAHGECRGIM
jgi:hypothetical protein